MNLGTAAEIQKALEERIPDLSAAARRWLERQRYISDIQLAEDPKKEFRHVIGLVRDFQHAGMRQPAMVPRRSITSMKEPTAQRDIAISWLLTGQADCEPDVQAFREQFLADGLLRHTEVESWIQAQEVPAHAVREGIIKYVVPGKEWERNWPVARGSNLARLRGIARRLAEAFPWTEAQAVVCILTGLPPLVSTIMSSVRGDLLRVGAIRITLSIDPRASPEEVRAAYAGIRRKHLPARYRPLGKRSLQLVIFRARNSSDESAQDMLRKWNKAHPEWRYPSVKAFNRDWRQARARLSGPAVRLEASFS